MGLQRQQQQQNNNPNENHKWHHSYHLEAEQSSAGGRVEGNWFQPPLSLVSPGPPALLLPWPETPLWVSRLPSFHVSLSLRLEWPKWKPVSACAQDLWRVGLQRPSHALGRTKGPQSPRAFYWMEDAHINQTAAFFPSAWRAHFHPESPGWWGWAGGGWWASGGLGQWGGEQRGCSGHGGWVDQRREPTESWAQSRCRHFCLAAWALWLPFKEVSSALLCPPLPRIQTISAFTQAHGCLYAGE